MSAMLPIATDFFTAQRNDAMCHKRAFALQQCREVSQGNSAIGRHDADGYPFTPSPTSAHTSRANVLICVGGTENLNSNVVMMKSAKESRHATSGRQYLLGEFDCKDLWLALSSNWS